MVTLWSPYGTVWPFTCSPCEAACLRVFSGHIDAVLAIALHPAAEGEMVLVSGASVCDACVMP